MTLQISMPIFDGGLILGADSTRTGKWCGRARSTWSRSQRTADQDTRTAFVNFNAARGTGDRAARGGQRYAAANLEAQVDDYRRGVVSNLDVLTALQDYQTARVQLHNANMTGAA